MVAKKIMHSCISLDYLAEHLDAFDCPPEEALHSIARERAKGFKFWPACDNIDSLGHCAGHETPEEVTPTKPR